MTLGKKDKRVLEAFLFDGLPCDGHKLYTDGYRLDGHWIGGHGIAEHVHVLGKHGLKIKFNDLGSRASQSVQKAIKKLVSKERLA